MLVVAISGCAGDELPRTDDARSAQRFVSLTPNVTEMIFAIGCGDRLVAVDSNSDHPAAVENLPKVGGMNPSLERILAARPDVVIGSSIGQYERIAAQLESRGIRFESVTADRLQQIPDAMEQLRVSLDCSGGDETIRTIAALEGEGIAGAPKVLIVASHDPLYVAGHSTFLDDLLIAAGGANALPADVTGWPAYSIEAVLAHPPDVVLVLSSRDRWPSLRAQIQNAPGWRELPAVREGRLALLDEGVATRPGPRVIETRKMIAETLQRTATQ